MVLERSLDPSIASPAFLTNDRMTLVLAYLTQQTYIGASSPWKLSTVRSRIYSKGMVIASAS